MIGRHPVLVALAALVSLSACRATKDSCADRVATMRSALVDVRRARALEDRVVSIARLVAGEGEVVEPAAVVTLLDDHAYYDGEEVSSLERRLLDERPASVGVAIDERTRWAVVVEALAAIERSGATESWLLLRGPAEASLAGTVLGEKLQLGHEFDRAGGRCEELIELIGTAEPEHYATRVLDGAPDALAACRCRGDVEELTVLLQMLFAPAEPLVGVPLDRIASATITVGDPQVTWASVAEQVLGRGP